MALQQTSKIKKYLKADRSGYIFALIAALLTGMIHSLPKSFLSFSSSGTEINPLTLTAIIYLVNGVFFTSIKKDSSAITKIGNRNLILIIIIAAAEISGLVAYFFGLRQSTAVNGSILTNGEIIFSVLIALTIFKERLDKKEIIPFGAIIFGIILLPIGYELAKSNMSITDLLFGNILILLSGVFCATDIIICKYIVGKVDPKRITQLTSFLGLGMVLTIMLVFNVPFQIDPFQIPSIALLGLFGTGFATFLFLTALRIIGTTRTVLLYSTNFIFGVILAVVFLRESLTLVNIFSIASASVGIYLLRNRLGSVEKHIPPIEKHPKKGFTNLCNSCQNHSCCTTFHSPILFSEDINNLRKINKNNETYVKELKIRGKTVKTIRKKNDSFECIFWNNASKKCSIYKNRPVDCMLYPFDIFLINGKYHWVVYSCNPGSNWQWSESHLQFFENNFQFKDILENLDIYHSYETNDMDDLKHPPYLVLREINLNKLLAI